MLRYCRMIEALNDFIQKACDNETLGPRVRECRVCEDRKARLRRFGRKSPRGCNARCRPEFRGRALSWLLRRHSAEGCALLIRIGEVGVWLYPDESTENGAGAIVEGVLYRRSLAVCGETWSCNVRASNSCSCFATATASRSLRPPSPMRRLKLSKRE